MGWIADHFFKRDRSKFEFQFGGANSTELAMALRGFADAIERGQVVIYEVHTMVRAKYNDFLMCSLILRYAEKR